MIKQSKPLRQVPEQLHGDELSVIVEDDLSDKPQESEVFLSEISSEQIESDFGKFSEQYSGLMKECF